MPRMPPTVLSRGMRSRAEARRAYDEKRRREQEYRKLYYTPQWRHIKREQLASEPYCRMCAAEGVTTVATVCDHVEPHGGDVEKFYAGPFQSLCKPCHDGPKQREERALAASRA